MRAREAARPKQRLAIENSAEGRSGKRAEQQVADLKEVQLAHELILVDFVGNTVALAERLIDLVGDVLRAGVESDMALLLG